MSDKIWDSQLQQASVKHLRDVETKRLALILENKEELSFMLESVSIDPNLGKWSDDGRTWYSPSEVEVPFVVAQKFETRHDDDYMAYYVGDLSIGVANCIISIRINVARKGMLASDETLHLTFDAIETYRQHISGQSASR